MTDKINKIQKEKVLKQIKKHKHSFIPVNNQLICDSCGVVLSLSDAAYKINLLEQIISTTNDDYTKLYKMLGNFLKRKVITKVDNDGNSIPFKNKK